MKLFVKHGTDRKRNAEEKYSLLSRQFSLSEIDEIHGQIELISLATQLIFQIWSPGAFCKLQNDTSGKEFDPNEEVIAEVEAYFGSKIESSYRKSIKKLEGD